MWSQETPNLKLPYIVAAQAQKHVTHNEAIRALDAIVHIAVLDATLASPPSEPTDGDRYIVAADATDAWVSRSGHIAAWQDGAWQFYQPREGWLVWDRSGELLLVWDGTTWTSAGGGHQNLAMMGINATADATNRLVAAAAATLLSHEGAGHQLKINKAAIGDTASLLLQDDFSGRAELGLTGNDDLHVKVSPDGSAWHEAMIVDRSTGRVRFPSGGVREVLQADRVYYVATTGSNANDGLSAATPVQTIADAVGRAYRIDSNGYAVTIQLAAGTYSALGAAVIVDRPLVGGARLEILGNPAAPSDVVIVGGWPSALFSGGCRVGLRHMRVESNAAGSLIQALEGADVYIDNIVFGATSRYHMEIDGGARLRIAGNYTIDGNAALAHMIVISGATVSGDNRTVTLTGTPSFGGAFVAVDAGIYAVWNQTWTGAATGKRYSATLNGIINTFGKGTSHFPGDIAGTIASGGQYV